MVEVPYFFMYIVLLVNHIYAFDPLNILEGMFFSSFFCVFHGLCWIMIVFLRAMWFLLLFVANKGRSIKNVLHRYMIFFGIVYQCTMHWQVISFFFIEISIDLQMKCALWFDFRMHCVYTENWEQFWGHLRILFWHKIKQYHLYDRKGLPRNLAKVFFIDPYGEDVDNDCWWHHPVFYVVVAYVLSIILLHILL